MYVSTGSKGPIILDNDTKYVEKLTHGTSKPVNAVCPLCAEKRVARYSSVIKSGSTYCMGCAQTVSAYGHMIGQRYGSLVVLGLADWYTKTDNRRVTGFLVHCDCGVERVVEAAGVKSGATISCGCYTVERVTEWCKSNAGELHPLYDHTMNDEEREELELARNSYKATAWSNAVKKRDGCCLKCGSTRNLVAHHIMRFKDNKDKRYDLENGITLCSECHKNFHIGQMGTWNTPYTPLDFQTFGYGSFSEVWNTALKSQKLKAFKEFISGNRFLKFLAENLG